MPFVFMSKSRNGPEWAPFQENLAIDRFGSWSFGWRDLAARSSTNYVSSWSLRFRFRRRRSPAPVPIWRAAFGRGAPHFRLPLPVISATAPGVLAARQVWCRTSSWRNTHFDFPVGVGDAAMVPGVFSAPPVPVTASLRGVLTLPARWISLSMALPPSVF